MTALPTASTFLARLTAEASEKQRVSYRRYFPGDESFIGVPMRTVFALAKEPERRTAVVATAAFIGRGQVDDTLAISRRLLDDPHPLVHKGAGWMLRYVGDVDRPALRSFLDEFAPTMPRTMLRAAVEKLDPDERKRHLAAHRASG